LETSASGHLQVYNRSRKSPCQTGRRQERTKKGDILSKAT
jgi:hypothetical protein